MNANTSTIGLDLGDRRHHACVRDEAGEILAEEAIANSREVLNAYCARYPKATVVMETGTHSRGSRSPGARSQRAQGAGDLWHGRLTPPREVRMEA